MLSVHNLKHLSPSSWIEVHLSLSYLKKRFHLISWHLKYWLALNTNIQELLWLKKQQSFIRKVSHLYFLLFATWILDLGLYNSRSHSPSSSRNSDGDGSTSLLCWGSFHFLSFFSSHCFHKYLSILGPNFRFRRDYL